ncbi:hypothetical protein BDW22DRAFT_180432 [Trametopsis cervina]|nr:hypothetical protein BDW22DRAFT_180432 [Trametopsis cervina]
MRGDQYLIEVLLQASSPSSKSSRPSDNALPAPRHDRNLSTSTMFRTASRAVKTENRGRHVVSTWMIAVGPVLTGTSKEAHLHPDFTAKIAQRELAVRRGFRAGSDDIHSLSSCVRDFWLNCIACISKVAHRARPMIRTCLSPSSCLLQTMVLSFHTNTKIQQDTSTPTATNSSDTMGHHCCQ